MRFEIRIGSRQTRKTRDASAAEIEEMVGRVVRQELARLVAQPSELPQKPDQSEILAAMQWLAPFLQQTVLEAVRLGLAARGELATSPIAPFPELPEGRSAALDAAGVVTSEQVGPRSGGYEEAPGENRLPSRLIEARECDEAGGTPALQESDRAAGSPVFEEDDDPAARSMLEKDGDLAARPAAAVETMEPGGPSTLGRAPGPAGVRVTLVATPVVGFAAVQRFLRDLGRAPEIEDVQTVRFTGGRLYVALTTDYPDWESLTAALEAGLAAYGPVVADVDGEFVEMRLTKRE